MVEKVESDEILYNFNVRAALWCLTVGGREAFLEENPGGFILPRPSPFLFLSFPKWL